MIISIVVAVSQNNVIGKDNKLPWHLPADMKYFKSITMGHHIIMGRSTYDSLGKPLPGRTNIIITRQEDFIVDGGVVLHDIRSGLDYARMNHETECFVIGGGEIIRQAMVWADKIYLTRIFQNFEGDTFFPVLKDDWTMAHEERHEPDEKNRYPWSFQVFELSKQSQNQEN